jgi:hypothetical protein
MFEEDPRPALQAIDQSLDFKHFDLAREFVSFYLSASPAKHTNASLILLGCSLYR